MIKKRYILIPLFGVITFVIMIAIVGSFLFLRNADSTEMVFAPTEVGTPEGKNVTKDIGSAGGTLISPDGRLAITVPQNALTETLPFSISPITNKAESALGLAYRLGPNGATCD